ncbi:hypothetical protein Mapa_000612 [Marchantia paleacea]|nr:hypothetical protein Mapa_000612 [Marchantia paleacea]
MPTDDVVISCQSAEDRIATDKVLAHDTEMSWVFYPQVLGHTLYGCHVVYADKHICWSAYSEK